MILSAVRVITSYSIHYTKLYDDAIKSLNLDIAGEFLVMAATLVHIKSRLLLPQADEESGEEEEEVV